MNAELLTALGFYALAGLALAGALGLIIASDVFHDALFLVLTLGSVAGIFVILGADFLAVVQVLIYVGAIMILILFGIMLTPQLGNLPNTGGPGQIAAGVIAAVAVLGTILAVITTATWPRASAAPIDLPAGTTSLLGTSLFNSFALPFEVASVLLLIAMIGALVIAREP
ncbi:MAG TPA: NADH-quinone oxidoreductase subunit J [Chloroflexota bacterium]|jgi:NADH-quinone oxidoreductase subunit J